MFLRYPSTCHEFPQPPLGLLAPVDFTTLYQTGCHFVLSLNSLGKGPLPSILLDQLSVIEGAESIKSNISCSVAPLSVLFSVRWFILPQPTE